MMPDFIYKGGAFYLADIAGWIVCRTLNNDPIEWRVFMRGFHVWHDLDNDEMNLLRSLLGSTTHKANTDS